MYPLPGDNSNFYEYNNAGQISSEVQSPFESLLRMKQGPGDSPFDIEQDAYLTKLLEEVFNNGEEFVEQKDYDPHLYDNTNVLSNRNVYDGESVSFGDIDTEIAQMQCQQDNAASEWSNEILQMGTSPQYFQSNLSFHDTEATRQNTATISDDFLELDPLFDDSNYIFSLDIIPDQTNSSHFSGDYTGAGGTGIKIRTRQPSTRPASESFVSQGIAPRRIRLQMEITGKVCEEEEEEESETKSTTTEEITDESKETISHKGVENDDVQISSEATSKLRRRMKSSESSSHQMEFSVISDLPAEVHRSKTRSSSLYIVFYICILALLVFAFVLIYVGA